MKLRIINPDSGITEDGIKFRLERLRPFVRPDTELSMVCPQESNLCIDSCLDVALDAPELVRLAFQAQEDGCDAVCLYCFSDPAFDACREMLDIPLVGGAQSSILLASGLANSFSVLVTSKRRISQKKVFIRTLSPDPGKLASVRSVEMEPDASIKPIEMLKRLEDVGRKCIDEDGADALVLGCLSFVATGRELTQRLGVPVIDPAAAMLTTAESLVIQGLCHSKKSWPHPSSKYRFWGAGSIGH